MRFFFSALCLTLALAYSAIPAQAEEDPVLNIYNWADYIGQDTLARFERETGIRVNYDVYDSSPTVDAKLLAGNSGYDIVIHSAAYSTRLQEAGIYQELDRNRLDNWEQLDPALLERFQMFDPGNRFGVPYSWGSTGFSYNREMILERYPEAPLGSARMLFDPEVIKHFADCGVSFLEASDDVIPMALLYLGRDPNSIEPEDLAAAVEVLQAVRPYVKYYSSTKFMLDLPNGEVCLAGSWSGDYATVTTRARESGLDMSFEYTVPVEGSTMWFDAAYIPADAPHPENAHRFLNFLLQPDVMAEFTNFTGYANALPAATPLVDPAYAEDPAVYPDQQTLERLHSTPIYGPKLERRRTRAWTRAKSGL